MRAGKLVLISTLAIVVFASRVAADNALLNVAKQSFEKGEYSKVISLLEPAAAKDPNNGDIQLLLAKAYLRSNQLDASIKSAEKAVAINPQNSEYHNWLGQAYGEKASHASLFSAYPLARKTQKEFETAVQLDAHNFDAAQNLVEYDCTAPSVVGGGDDKAQPLIQKLLTLDAAQGHYAAGNCRLQKKEFVAVDSEFTKALDSEPKSVDLICNIADYFAHRGQGEKVLAAARAAESVAPADPRVKFFQAVGWILQKEQPSEAEKNLKDFPSTSSSHYWLGRLYESQKNVSSAKAEYRTALQMNDKNKEAQEGLKRLGGN